jgi:hypothetical protein
MALVTVRLARLQDHSEIFVGVQRVRDPELPEI